jgi:hypothetical protein
VPLGADAGVGRNRALERGTRFREWFEEIDVSGGGRLLATVEGEPSAEEKDEDDDDQQ